MNENKSLFSQYFDAIIIEPRKGVYRITCVQAAQALARSGQFGDTDVYVEHNEARIPIKLGDHIVEYDFNSPQLENLIQQHYEAKTNGNIDDPLWHFAFEQSVEKQLKKEKTL